MRFRQMDERDGNCLEHHGCKVRDSSTSNSKWEREQYEGKSDVNDPFPRMGRFEVNVQIQGQSLHRVTSVKE